MDEMRIYDGIVDNEIHLMFQPFLLCYLFALSMSFVTINLKKSRVRIQVCVFE